MREDVYIKIAYWYYTLGMTQDEIAKRLSFTRQKVNQIINSLMDLGIVTKATKEIILSWSVSWKKPIL